MTFAQKADVIEKLRRDALMHKNVESLLALLASDLSLGKSDRLKAVDCFRQAFDLSIKDASQIGAWDFFEGGTWTSTLLQTQIGPLIEAWVNSNNMKT